MMRRPQFSLKTVLWLMAVVAAFAGGMGAQTKIFERERRSMRLQEQHMVERDRELIQREATLPYGGIMGGSNLIPEVCPMCGKPKDQ